MLVSYVSCGACEDMPAGFVIATDTILCPMLENTLKGSESTWIVPNTEVEYDDNI